MKELGGVLVIGYEAYYFLNGYLRYHQISIAPKYKYRLHLL
jgi:hypothetical protein